MVKKEALMASGRERILIVAVNEAVGNSLQKLLGEYGYATEVVSDESRAVDASRRKLPTLILVERQGRFEQLRREPALRAVPIVTLQQPEARCEEEACLEDLEPRVVVPEEIAKKARLAIQRMLEISDPGGYARKAEPKQPVD